MLRSQYYYYLAAALCLICTSAAVGASPTSPSASASSSSLYSSKVSSSLSKLTKSLSQDMVDKELRRWITETHAESMKEVKALQLLNNNNKADEDGDEDEDEDWFALSPTSRTRRLNENTTTEGDWDGLNEILANFELAIPDIEFQQDLFGFTLTVKANGTCEKLRVGELKLDWDKGSAAAIYDDVSLAYKFQILDIALNCYLSVSWNTGVLDVGDDLKIKLKVNESNFGVAVNLLGAPPTTSNFVGCKVVLDVGEIKSSGGFSSNIINDLNDAVVGLVASNTFLASDLVCETLANFTETLDEILGDINELLDPFIITNATAVDPLFLEDTIDPSLDLVSFYDETGLGNIINVVISNLAGIITADTLNTLIESTFLDDNGVFTLVLEETLPWEQEEGGERNATTVSNATIVRLLQGGTGTEPPVDEVDEIVELIPRVCNPLGDLLGGRRLADALEDHVNGENGDERRRLQDQHRRLQFEDVGLEDLVNTTNLLQINDITPMNISVTGLNNFTTENALTVIGDYTLATELLLPGIQLDAVVALDVTVNGVPVQEVITINFDITGILINASFLLGLDSEVVETWTIGTFLNTSNLIPCLLSAVSTAGVSQLLVTVGSIGVPIVSDAFSPGVIELLNTGVEGGACVYEQLILEAIPGFFQTNVTVLVNDFIECFIETEGANAVCPGTSSGGGNAPDDDVDFDFKQNSLTRSFSATKQASNSGLMMAEYLDFRDLLLGPEDAKVMGGSGAMPYGDLVAMGFDLLQGTLSEEEKQGNVTELPAINGFLGDEGLELDFQLIDTVMDTSNMTFINLLLDSANISAYNVRAQNLNTIQNPFKFLEPTTQAHVLSNIINFGPVPSRGLNATFTVLMELAGPDSPLALFSEFDIGGRVQELDLTADFQVLISASSFIDFPIADILELDCWFALAEDPAAFATKEEKVPNSFEITSMLLDITQLSMGLECLDCTGKTMPEVFALLDEVGAVGVLGSRLGGLIEEISTSDIFPPLIKDTLGIGTAAARNCPHHALYKTLSEEEPTTEMVLPQLTNRSLDTVVYTGILGAEIFSVVLAESHINNNITLSDPRSGEMTFNAVGKENLLDWFRLNETFIPLAGFGLEFIRDFLGATEDGRPGVNELLTDFLEADGSFSLTPEIVLELIEGYNITVDKLEIIGLNTFSVFDILQPFASQTLRNSIELDKLSVAVEFSVNATNTSDPAQPYKIAFEVDDIKGDIYLFTAIDLDRIESFELGSLLFIDNILPCMLSSAYDVHIPAIRATIGNLSKPVVEGLLPDTNEASMNSISALFDKYESLFVEATNAIFDTSIRKIVNEYVTDYIAGSPVCLGRDDLVDSASEKLPYVDFRDLLLSPENSLALGGSGLQPYGDIPATVYSLILDQLVSNKTGEYLGINALIEDFTEGESGKQGMVRLQEELFSFVIDEIPFEFLEWANLTAELSTFDGRLENVNTLTSPIALARPTDSPYLLDNLFNFGPNATHPLIATLGALLGIDGELKSLNMLNKFDVIGQLEQLELFAAINIYLLEENLLRFPLRDILEIDCWFSMFPTPNLATNTSAFDLQTLLPKLVSLSTGVDCYNCTSRVLSEAVEVVDGAGVSLTLGDRLGFLLEEISTSESVSLLLNDFIDFGDEAGRSCPHHPLFNTTSMANETDVELTLPPLSSLSIDTILFVGVMFAQVSVIVGADNHLQNPGETNDPVDFAEILEIPEEAKLINWTNLEESDIPFLVEILDLVTGQLSDVSETEDGRQELGVNTLARDFLDENGTFSFPLDFSFNASGVELVVSTVRVQGLDTFSQMDILNPVKAFTLQNNVSLDKLRLGLDMSVNVLDSDEPPNQLNMTFDLQSVNMSIPLFLAVDEYKVSNLTVGSLLHMSNLLPCLLSTTYGVQIEQLLVTIGELSAPTFEGLLPDTSKAAARASKRLYKRFGDMIVESIPLVFEDTLRVVINSFLGSFEDSDCQDYSANTTSRFVDFREMFRPGNTTGFSPYGDILPLLRDTFDDLLFENDPETQMPKINDVLIAPFTADQSGVEGTLLLPGKILGFDTEALAEVGLGITGIELSDARIENLDTVGQPLKVLEPNATRGDLLNNRATFGTQFSPLRFAVRISLSFLGPFINTRDEMDVFGELRSAPIYAILLARLGAKEFLKLPLGHATNTDCWLASLALPALDEIAAGNLEVNPVLSLDYLNIAFQSMRISASCFNCTTRGLEVVPELLEILETTTSKNVLGYRNTELMLGLINSNFVQVWLLRFFQDSIQGCDYLANSTSIDVEYENPDFPDLNEYNMETGVFTVTVMVQLALVILAETISVLEDAEPLFSDPEPNIPPETRLVDFTALDEYELGGLIESAIDGLNSFLGAPSVDEDTGETALAINELLGNPLIPIPLNTLSFDEQIDIGIAGLKVNINGITISGLDTFTQFNIANITGPTMLGHKLGWERLQLEIKLEVDLTGTTPAANQFARVLQNGVEYEESNPANDGKFQFDLTIELADIAIDMKTFIALDYELLKYVELGNFLRFGNIIPCIQATILHLEVTELLMEIGKVTKMQVSGWTSEDTRIAAENLEETLIERFGKTIASMAPNTVSAALRPLMNTFITSYLRDSDVKCEEFALDEQSDGFVDFRDLFLAPSAALEFGGSGKEQYGDLIHTIFLYSKLVVRLFILPLIPVLDFPGAIVDQGLRFDVRNFQSIFVLRIEDLKIENVKSIGTLLYVEPIEEEAHTVNNEISLGFGRTPISIKFRVYFAFKGLDGDIAGVDIANDFEVSFDIKTLKIVLDALMKVHEQSFIDFPLRNMLNLNCWLALIPPPELDESGKRLPGSKDTFSVEQLLISLKELNMGIKCDNCTSPDLYKFDDLLQEPGASEELTRVSNRIMQGLANRLGGEFLQDQIDQLLVSAPQFCPHTDNYDPDAQPFTIDLAPVNMTNPTPYLYYLLAICVPLLLGLIVILVVRAIVHRRHKKWLASLPSERVFLVQQKQEKEDHVDSEMNELTQSMFESNQVGWLAQYFVPFIVIVNIGFFLSGHLSLGARAVIDFNIAGESFRLDNFYDFSIASSTLDLWYAGGEELAALILLFSGVWPYTKQLITLSLWFLRPSVVSVSRRGQFLVWLDILAKWSMIDIFVIIITIASFRISGSSPEYPFLPSSIYQVDLFIVPMWGLYANLLAQLMSQISSHFIVMYHRRIVKAGQKKYQERHHLQTSAEVASGESNPAVLLSPETANDVKKDQLSTYRFTRLHKDGDKLVARRTANVFLPFVSALLSALIAMCCVLPSLKLEAHGLIGIILELGTKFAEDAVRYESIFSKATTLVQQAFYMGESKHYVGNIFLATMFILTLLVVPIAMLAIMMYMWLFPQTQERREKIAITIETLQAWQYVEVYILGMIIESWQLGQVSKLFLNRYCDSLNPLLETLAAYGILDPKDAQCFELEASIASGAYLMIPFVFGLALVGSYVIKAYIQYLREKNEEEEDSPEENKLRAFDRTTWDNRENALESIRHPPVLFTDTFRWTLRTIAPGDNSTVSSQPEALLGEGSDKSEDDGVADEAETPLIHENTSSSGSEAGYKAPVPLDEGESNSED